MKIRTLKLLLFSSLLTAFGCARSLTPREFIDQFPRLTSSQFYNQVEGNKAVSEGKCSVLVNDRKYTAPMGFSANADLTNGAEGIDEWVQVDGGNAFILSNYEWVEVGDDGNTQLMLYFDTLLCD
jgi:hypothetical protein